MAVTRIVTNRIIRRYKCFFIVGIIILSIQFYLAFIFFILNSKEINDKVYDSNKYENIDENSARRSKDISIIDDEDISNSNSIKQKEQIKLAINSTLVSLNFRPSCEILSKEALSAINRANTSYCKHLIANISCLIQNDEFYPKKLPNSCPVVKKNESSQHLGCYKDDKYSRLLPSYFYNFNEINSPEHCIQVCLQTGFVYSGVQFSSECFCGNSKPSNLLKLPDPSCNMKCPGNPNKNCGGYFTMNIYKTGISSAFNYQPELTTKSTDEPIRIVYLLTLNGRALRQIYRLLKVLYHKNHYFYIHVDVRQDYLFRELAKLENKFPNIHITHDRFATIWGGASLLRMLLRSMYNLLTNLSNWKWDFVINLSESDFPIKTTEKLVAYLTANRNCNFVKSHGRDVQRFIQKQGLDKTFVECDAHMWRIGDRKLPQNIQIDGGSDWVALSKPFVTYVIESLKYSLDDKLFENNISNNHFFDNIKKDKSKEFTVHRSNDDILLEGVFKIFNYTLLPAESFFHTVLRNSKFCHTYIDNNLHVTNWKRKLGCKCQHKHIVDWCGCSPNDFRLDDWPRILATETKQLFFARKFEPIINQQIITKLEQWLFGKKFNKSSLNLNSYWQNIYHCADRTNDNDVIKTISSSLIRQFTNILHEQTNCFVNSFDLLEVFTYHFNDAYKGFLINFEINFNESFKTKIEIFVKNKNKLIKNGDTNLVKRLKSFYISSDFDQKEQISRNFGKFLGPYSDIYLVYEFLPNLIDTFDNLTIVFFDPTNQIVDVFNFNLDIVYTINFYKLSLKAPLLPGVWTVELVENLFGDNNLIAKMNFLISPLDLSETKAILVHGNINNYALGKKIQVPLKHSEDVDLLKLLAISNSKRTGVDLLNWIDSLVNKFFKIIDMCSLFNNLNCSNKLYHLCSKTNWSSYAPDPKSDLSYQLGGFNS